MNLRSGLQIPEKSTLPSAVRGVDAGVGLVAFGAAPWPRTRPGTATDQIAAIATAATIETGKRLLMVAASDQSEGVSQEVSRWGGIRSSSCCCQGPGVRGGMAV